jgi:hypothetical protein
MVRGAIIGDLDSEESLFTHSLISFLTTSLSLLALLNSSLMAIFCFCEGEAAISDSH